MIKVNLFNEDDVLIDTDVFDTREEAEAFLKLGVTFTGQEYDYYEITEVD